MKLIKLGIKPMAQANEIRRTPLVMMPDGRFLRGDEYVSEGVVVEEPPLYEKPQAVEDQTAAVLGHNE